MADPQAHGSGIGAAQTTLVVGFLVWTACDPHDFFTWVLEVSWVVVGLVVLGVLVRRGSVPTPILAWCLVLHAIILIYGGWYTYEHVPLGEWVSSRMGWERNHYDRLGHLAQGFFPAVLAREVLVRCRVVVGRAWRETIVFAFIMAFTAIFEIIEFAAAHIFGDGANAYLGSQGDVWDAQWDMVMCGIGGLVSIAFLMRWHESMLSRLRPSSDR